MAAIARRKKVTDPLDDKVKARIFGFSSGSEHSAHDSPCLSNLLCGFLDPKEEESQENENDDDSESEDYIDHHKNNVNLEILSQALIYDQDIDQFRNVLASQVSKAIEIFWFVKSNASLLRRNVMAFLRSEGYNAGICKTKWETSGGLIAGNYEFIDVVVKFDDVQNTRYFIDLNFSAEFEIARQTNEYEQLVQTLPRVYIGKCDPLKQIVKIMSDGARKSLKSRGLHLPPWRKNRFMQNKWFGPYRRTVNLISENVTSPTNERVKCRSVGFNAVNTVPLITRTR